MSSNSEILKKEVSIYKVYLHGNSYLFDYYILSEAFELVKKMNKDCLEENYYYEIRFK